MNTALAVTVAVTGLLCAVVTAAWGAVALSYWWEMNTRTQRRGLRIRKASSQPGGQRL